METPAVDLKTTGLAVAAVLLVEWGAKAAVHHAALPPLVVLGVARFMEILAFLAIASRAAPRGLRSIGVFADTWVAGLAKGFLWVAGFGLLASLAFALLWLAGVNPLPLMKAEMPATTRNLILFFLIGALVSPVAEEIFFRGILYGFLRKWGAPAAVLLSATLFVLAHAAVSRVPITQGVGGILFALAYERERHLLTPIVIHVCGNAAIFVLALIA